jgi:phosphomannomutase
VTLARLADQDGLHVTMQWAPRFEGHDGAARMRAATAALGDGDPIEVVFPEGRALVRPSGTEPKLKCYFETVLRLDESTAEGYEHARVGGLAACERMRDSLAKRLGPESRLAS